MRIAAFLLGLLVTSSTSGCYLHGVMLDVDHNPNTGCTVEINDANFDGELNGIDTVAFAGAFDPRFFPYDPNEYGLDPNSLDPNHLDPNMPLLVGGTVFGICDEGHNEFDFDSAGLQFAPVGINNGTNGADVIEFALPRAVLPPDTSQMYATFISSTIFEGAPEVLNGAGDIVGQLSDLLNGMSSGTIPHHTDVSPAGSQGFLITLAPGTSAPAVSHVGLALLSLSLLFLARRRLTGSLRGVASAALVLSLIGVAYAATITIDGQVPDWSGIAPLGADAVGDSSSDDDAEDIVATFATFDDQNVYFRIDVKDAFAGSYGGVP